MGNHFHLLVRMLPETEFSDAEVRTRFQRYYGADRERQLSDGQIPTLRAKWANLSDYKGKWGTFVERRNDSEYGARGRCTSYSGRARHRPYVPTPL